MGDIINFSKKLVTKKLHAGKKVSRKEFAHAFSKEISEINSKFKKEKKNSKNKLKKGWL